MICTECGQVDIPTWGGRYTTHRVSRIPGPWNGLPRICKASGQLVPHVIGYDQVTKESAMGIEQLRQDVHKTGRDDFETGTVIRWKTTCLGGEAWTTPRTYTYAAVKTPKGWYTTAQTSIGQVLTYEELVEVLSRETTSHVEVALAWETV